MLHVHVDIFLKQLKHISRVILSSENKHYNDYVVTKHNNSILRAVCWKIEVPL